jgi:predicted transposase/invertase (TIGR01784 family)
MQFFDIKTDFAFKKVFGSEESKDVLISFLNAIITFDQQETIVDLSIADPYQIPLIKGMKDSYVDIKARLSNGKRVIIEMQVLNVEGFEKRILYNAAKAYSQQLQKAEAYHTLQPIIALTICDFCMFPDITPVITRFRLIEKETLLHYPDEIELIFLELPKFSTKEENLLSISDKWIYFIKNAGRLDYIPKTLQAEPPIGKAFEIVNYAAMTPDEIEAQERRHDFIRQQKGALELAEKRGESIGIEKGEQIGLETGEQIGLEKGEKMGLEKGKMAAKLELARNLLDLLDIETIAAKTGLSCEEVRRLKSS